MAVSVVDKKAEGISILDKTIVLAVEFSRFGNRRKASLDAVDVNADKRMLSLSKRLLKSKKLDAIAKHDAGTKAYLDEIALPFPLRIGSRLIPIPIVEAVDATLVERQAERTQLVDDFIATDYALSVAEVKSQLRDLYNPADYPSVAEMRASFAMAWQYMDYGVPGRLKSMNLALFTAAKEKMAAQIQQATDEVQQALRASMAGLVSHMTERLATDAETGKPRVFKNSMIKKMQGFLDTFDVRNVTNDDELAGIVKQARAIVSGVDAQQLRDNDALRSAILQSFEQIKSKMDESGMIVEKTRRITFDDEQAGSEAV